MKKRISRMEDYPLLNLLDFGMRHKGISIDLRKKGGKAWTRFLGGREAVVEAVKKAWNRKCMKALHRPMCLLDAVAVRECYGYSPSEWHRIRKAKQAI